MNVTQLHDKYAPLTVKREDHFGNMVRAAGVQVDESWQKLPKPTDYKSWEMTPQMVNAYYSPTHNEIVFPAGILQPPFFFPGDVPDAVSYGAIGMVAGHELAHAFDQHGRLYDSQGRLIDWWSEKVAAEFDKRAQCFVEHYGNFSIVDPQGRKLHVNGKLTLGENLADAGGIAQSWRAWKARKSRDVRLPGMPATTPEQQFFLAFAQIWCGKAKPEYSLNLIRTDPHSPSWVRVNAGVQDAPQFAKAFKCPVGSKMNPAHKCEMW
ncbi:hypothetical protein AMAG_02956 [Allomyces macrogynus ATCC 38327]|uniref:Peptidase M13 C-terminal domain-containing protein n=1 Tax=Allomyces macrogynus (strain ATCC 38327) TaxID=578462 RepID=A0A0L0S3T4_ALLM3|nr:hypothetical protein AMAG_02956 [Allomyces macrogynus ATCC 38327]|eukprot:KNE57218.1 hypothetical protein AMAG_02956 [Allomyces macrogynus ATCC 38327]